MIRHFKSAARAARASLSAGTDNGWKGFARNALSAASSPLRFHSASSRAVNLADYEPYPYNIEKVHLDFKLGDDSSVCTSTLQISPPMPSARSRARLELDGQELNTVSVVLNGRELEHGDPDGYTIRTKPDGDDIMEILPAQHLKESFELQIQTHLEPEKNTKLEGLYRSSGTFCTQCEAQGFRRITWFPDRPDVMSKFSVCLTAEKDKCPVLLSNGNLVSSEEFQDTNAEGKVKTMHTTTWVDPFHKPAYLFAIVAGDLVALEDTFTTSPSGRNVDLKIWTQRHNADKTEFAMQSLKESFLWDEQRFGLEYDLDIFQIVAVDDFNMGAMENKSLNVFNSRLVLATPDTATDTDYERIQGVVGHEYFHNWTGNRVTCRDWFQLSLKEGLTVFRDQEFTADLNSRAVKRIADVRLLRAAQFPEDSGAMAHPIRPASYEKIDNFYTVTVYEKGAEIIRMYHTLLGEDGFMRGMDLYFNRHDGQAVTTDDFFDSMQDANPEIELGTPFRRWYSQAGTPEVQVEWAADDASSNGNAKPSTRFEMTVTQRTPITPDPGGENKLPVLIPMAVGLLDKDTGQDVDLSCDSISVYRVEANNNRLPVSPSLRSTSNADSNSSTAILLCESEATTFVFEGLPSNGVVPSILRDFSAPVRLSAPQIGTPELAFLLANDSDSFNRAEAASKLMSLMIEDSYKNMEASSSSSSTSNPSVWDINRSGYSAAVEGLRSILINEALDPAFRALVLEPPSAGEIIDNMKGSVNPLHIHHAKARVVRALADELAPELLQTYLRTNSSGTAYSWTPEEAGKRSLASRCLRYLVAQNDSKNREDAVQLAEAQFLNATNMSDSFSALVAINNIIGEVRDRCMRMFFDKWQSDNNVIVKYFMLESTTDIAQNANRLRAIMECASGEHVDNGSIKNIGSSFDITIPNHVYALCRAFPGSYVNFHADDGSGYQLLADWIIQVDALNAQVGSRLAGPFTKWLSYDEHRREMIRGQLERIMATDSLSPNTREIVAKSLAQGGGASSKL